METKERIPRIKDLTYDELGLDPVKTLWIKSNETNKLINLLFYKIEDLQQHVNDLQQHVNDLKKEVKSLPRNYGGAIL